MLGAGLASSATSRAHSSLLGTSPAVAYCQRVGHVHDEVSYRTQICEVEGCPDMANLIGRCWAHEQQEQTDLVARALVFKDKARKLERKRALEELTDIAARMTD